MYKEPGKNEKEEEEKEEREIERLSEKIRWDLEDIKDDLLDEIEDIHEDFEDEIDDLREAKEEIKDDLREALEDLKEERLDLIKEIGKTTEGLDDLGEDARGQIELARERLELIRIKTEEQREKYEDKIRKKLEKAQKKAQKKASKRINISVDSDTSDEWRDWSNELGSSVSELIRKSMKFVKNNIGDFKKLEEWGESIERAVKESGIEELGEKMGREFEGGKGKNVKPRIKIKLPSSNDKDRIKKRVRGLIKLQKSLPIDKLAQALNKTDEDAENLIYELVDEGIEGSLEDGIFKFTSSPDEVISKINDLIDKM